MSGVRGYFYGGLLLAAVAGPGCHGPTQVTVALSTDLDCSAGVTTSISEGAPGDIARVAPATTTTICNGGDIGTLVFVPSHARDDRLAVQVVTAVGVPLESCTPPAFGKNCIVATRSLHYIPHTALTLPIVMRSACRGVLCGDGQTCSNGACTSAEIDPSTCVGPAGCVEPAPPPPSDGGAPPVDAGLVDAGDAGPLPGVDASVPPDTVVTGRRYIASITADGTGAYWTELGDYSMANGGAYRLTNGGAVSTIAANRESPSIIVTDTVSVFWAELLGAGIVRAPVGGGAATALPIGGTGVNMTVIALDDTHVYWNNESVGVTDGLVRRALKDGSGATSIATAVKDGPWAMAVVGTTVAFVTAKQFGGAGQVSTIPTTGGAPSFVASLVGSSSRARIAAGGGNLAWTTTDNGGSVMARTAAGVIALATGQGEIASLTASPTSVYWVHGPAAGAGSLARASWSGGAAQPLFDGVAVPGPIAVNASFVYFVDNRIGEIKRLPN